MKYYVSKGLRFDVTKSFIDIDNPVKNINDCNSYLESKDLEEGVIWNSSDYSIIIVARNDDMGTPLKDIK